NPRGRGNPGPPSEPATHRRNFPARAAPPMPDKSEPYAVPEPRAMSIPAPYERFEGEVLPEWIDYNGHMNLAYYTVLFDYATDLLFDERSEEHTSELQSHL